MATTSLDQAGYYAPNPGNPFSGTLPALGPAISFSGYGPPTATPFNPQQGAIAYSLDDSTAPFYGWDVATQSWVSGTVGGGGGGSVQIKTYVSDPNAEAVKPQSQSLAALCYKQANPSGQWYQWNTTSHVWE